MEVLEKISSHPHFGKSVRSITCAPKSIFLPPLHEEWKAWATKLMAGSQALNPEQKAQYLQLRRKYDAMRPGRRQRVAWEDKLSNALQNFTKLGNTNLTVSIGCTDGYPRLVDPALQEIRLTLEAKFALQKLLLGCDDDERPIPAFIRITHSSRCVSKLRLLDSVDDNHVRDIRVFMGLRSSRIVSSDGVNEGFSTL